MDLFSPALRQLSRAAHRAMATGLLWQRRRQLAKAQTALGLLGWQQADFDSETQQQVDAINNVEREQGRLINDSAECANKIRALRSEAEALRRDHQEQRLRRSAELRRLRDPLTQLEQQLAEKRKVEPVFERRMPELDRELREVNKLLAELIRVEKQAPKIRQELIRLRERTVAIPNEKNDLRTQHFRTVHEMRELEEAATSAKQAVAEHEAQQQTLEREWSERERELATRLKDLEREKAQMEKQVADLESAKTNPYQQIGRVLATAGVAPMNQPHALEEVKRLEFAIGELEVGIHDSRRASAAEDRRALLSSYAVWAALLFGAVLIIWAAVSGG